MRVLVLDDIKYRHDVFDKVYSDDQVAHAYTYNDFVNLLTNGPWDLIHLDHDLGDFVDNASTYVDGWGNKVEYNGSDASLRICELPDNFLPKKIIIHSVNGVGSHRMMAYLKRRGIDVVWEPFSTNPEYYNDGTAISGW